MLPTPLALFCVNLRRVSLKIWRKGIWIDSATVQMSPAAYFRVVSAGIYSSEAGWYEHFVQRILCNGSVKEEGSESQGMTPSLRVIYAR